MNGITKFSIPAVAVLMLAACGSDDSTDTASTATDTTTTTTTTPAAQNFVGTTGIDTFTGGGGVGAAGGASGSPATCHAGCARTCLPPRVTPAARAHASRHGKARTPGQAG